MRERFNTVAVAIPAQQFHVRCHVSVDRQVPVMTEFAVRLLHLSGSIEVGALRGYFGLSGEELVDLVELLRSEGLVEETDGRLSLTSYAEARFVTSEDGLPRFTRIVERQSRPIFELLSFSPISKALSSTYWDNTLELDWSPKVDPTKKTVEQAESAFHKHFSDIERLEQDERHRAFSCYKVDSITSGRPFNIPLPMHFEVDFDGNVEFDLDGQLELLPEELRSTVRRLTADRIGGLVAHTDRFKEFVDYFGDEVLQRYRQGPSGNGDKLAPEKTLTIRKPAEFGFSSYVREVHAAADGRAYGDNQSLALLGALYMPKNQDRLVAGLATAAQRFKKAASGDTTFPPEMLWVVPDTDLWGRTDLVRSLNERLSAAVAEAWGEERELVALVPAPEMMPPERVRRLGSLLLDAGFGRVVFGPPCSPFERFEALLLPSVYGAAMYQWKVPSMNVLSVPIGFATSSPERLRRLAEFTRGAAARATHRVWRTSGLPGEGRRLQNGPTSPEDFQYLDSFVAR